MGHSSLLFFSNCKGGANEPGAAKISQNEPPELISGVSSGAGAKAVFRLEFTFLS
jgi:hypothetical protein